jgi:hypothetical protein
MKTEWLIALVSGAEFARLLSACFTAPQGKQGVINTTKMAMCA